MQQPIKWEDRLTDRHNLLVACVGYNYGPNPAEKIDEIRKARGAYAFQVVDYLELKKNDVVLDMGSGCGFLARNISPYVKELHCADLNEDFLSFCREEVSEFKNVTCHSMKYADLSELNFLGVNKVYSTAVWIHFNFYDMVLNLKSLNSLLPLGGQVFFDYLDPSGIKDGDGRIFREHLESYQQSKDSYPVLVKYTGTDSVKVAAKMCGFTVKKTFQV